MTKDEFITKRTEIISKMLDNPDEYEIYPTGRCFAELDDLYDLITENSEPKYSAAQLERNRRLEHVNN